MDLSGWKKHPIKPGFWRVDEDGHLVGAGPVDFAFLGTVRDDFENFHLRVEAMVDTPESDSGVFFRVPSLEEGCGFDEINISSDPARPGAQTGSLLVEIPGKSVWYPAATGLTKPREWFILEIIARGDHVVTKVNGKLALDTEVQTANRRGRIYLQQCGGNTIVRFRKIEIKELPPAGVRIESGAKDKPSSPAIAPFADADDQRIAALPAAEQVEEVRKELKRRNPGFDGKMETKIEGGVVTEFQIVSDKVTDIAPIRVFDALRVLVCSGRSNGLLADLTPLEGMNLAALTGLGLWKTKVSDAGLANFKDCKGLTHLGLGWTKVSDAGLANFKGCKNLIQFWIHDTQVGDAGMVHFQDCKSLTDLNLAGTKVSDVGLANFKDCKNLKYLWLDRAQVGDAGLAQLKGIPLRALSIDNTGITDLTPLRGMPLEEVRLTPKNITRGLDIIRDMKSLKTIGIAYQQTWPAAEFLQRYDRGEFK